MKKKKSIKKIKKCKNICKFCHNHYDDNTCSEFFNDVPNCVTGETERVYDECIKHNKCGCCKKYSENKELVLKQKILDAIKKYQQERWSSHGHDESLIDMLCGESENAIEGHETNFYSNPDGQGYSYKYDHTGNYTKYYEKIKRGDC